MTQTLGRARGLVKGFFAVLMSGSGVRVVKVQRTRGGSVRESTVAVVCPGSQDRQEVLKP